MLPRVHLRSEGVGRAGVSCSQAQISRQCDSPGVGSLFRLCISFCWGTVDTDPA